MEPNIENAAIRMDGQTMQRKRLERRWLWIALLPLLNTFYTASAAIAYFELVSGLNDTLTYGMGYVLMAAGLFLLPMLLQKRGILDDPRGFRVVFTTAFTLGVLAFVTLSAIFLKTSAPPAGWFAVIFVYISMIAPGLAAGCALHRAVKVLNGKSAAALSGYTVIMLSLIAAAHTVFINTFAAIISDMPAAVISTYAYAVLSVSYIILYAVPLIIAVVLIFSGKDDLPPHAPKENPYFSETLFFKFMLLAVLMVVLDTFSDASYYFEGNTEHINNWIQAALLFVPIPSAWVLTRLLRKNRWLLAMAACTLLICLQQGLILFIENAGQLAVLYFVSDGLSGQGPVIFLLFIPLAFSMHGRKSANAATGMLAIFLLFYAITVVTSPSLYNSLSPFTAPAITFIFTIATIAYLFYLHSENYRVYIAGLVAEFAARDIGEINEAVAKADRFEGLGLAPREKEVCALLLKSLTLRQISGELGLAFATVNGYYRSLYRKLEINSKAELFMRFGAEVSAPGGGAQPPGKL